MTPSMRGYSSLGDAESIFDNFDEGALASINRLSDMSHNIGDIADDTDFISLPSNYSDDRQHAMKGSKLVGAKIREKSDKSDKSTVTTDKTLKFAKPKPPPVPMKSTWLRRPG